MSNLRSVEGAMRAYARGDFVVVLENSGAQSKGYLVIAADSIDEAKIAFMMGHGNEALCAAMPQARAFELELPSRAGGNTETTQGTLTVPVEFRPGEQSDSIAGRVATLKSFLDPRTRPIDLTRPGHIHPLVSKEGGVLRRQGHAEAAVDLGILSGRSPVGVLSEILNPDGTVMPPSELLAFAEHHELQVLTVNNLIQYRQTRETQLERLATAKMPTRHGEFDIIAYRSALDGEEHVAFVLGEVAGAEDVLVRVHSECLTGDLFGSLRCDCGSQLDAALKMIGNQGRGVIVYLRGHEGRGIGIAHKVRAYALQDEGHDTVDANTVQGLPVDSRDYGVGAQILNDLGIRTLRLMTNNPFKYAALQEFGLEISERVGIDISPNPANARYLATKRERMGHLLGDSGTGAEGRTTSRS